MFVVYGCKYADKGKDLHLIREHVLLTSPERRHYAQITQRRAMKVSQRR